MSYRVRNDLEVFPMEGESQAAWVVRDPLSGNCYRLGMQEYHLFCDLQSGHPWKVIQERFHRRFPHQILTLDEFQRSVATWIRHRLILISTPQSAGQFTSGINRLGRFNPLFMRIPCWNPAERFQKCLPYLKWLYSRPIQLVTMLILLIAGLQIIAFLPVLQAEIRELPLRLGPATWWQVALLLMGFKVLHEIGHGLTCHHYGGRCREAGVMLLAFFPCLYCNVTDAWTFPRRSQRMHVTAAGILVDLLGAAVAFLLWTICAPGYLRDLLLLIALSGSLNSLLLNGNPLMRYDGYYLLSDWSGVPNLRAAAFTQVRQLLWRALFGRAKDGVPSPLSIPLLTYGVMSTVYLVLVISLILFALYHFLIPHQLDLLFLIIASLTILQMGMGIVLILAREGAQEMALRTGNPIRKGLLPSVVLLGLAGAMFIPLPHTISATAILRPSVSQAFIAPGSGMAYFEPGEAQKFQASQILLQIQSPELDALMLQLETELARLQAKAAALERVKGLYPDAIATLGVLQEMIAEVIQQKEDASSRKQELILTAQQNGSFLRTEQVPSHARKPGEGSFQQQSQNPIPVQKGELLGVVVPSGPLELLIEIPPSSQTFVKTGLSVSCFPPELGGWSLEASIAELAPAPVNLVQAGKTSLEYRQLSSLQSSVSPTPQRTLIALGVLSSQEMPPLTAYQICPVSIAAEPLSLAGRVLHFWQTQFSGNSLSAAP